MKAVLQRVSEAEVRVDGSVVGSIRRGWLILLGVARGDAPADVEKLARKILLLRAFEDDAGKMNLNVGQAGGGVLVVSQFTLLADLAGGNRPSFTPAAPPSEAEALYVRFAEELAAAGVPTERGVFGADMKVALVNDGPVTFVLDTRPPG